VSPAVVTAAAVGETLGPAAGHRHTVLIVTTLHEADGYRGQRG
jgi:hypothetical protein